MRLTPVLVIAACSSGARTARPIDLGARPYTQLLEPGAAWNFVLDIETPDQATTASLRCKVGERRTEGDVFIAPLACRASIPLGTAELGLTNEELLETAAGMFSTRRGPATAIIKTPADVAKLVTPDRLLVAVSPAASSTHEHHACCKPAPDAPAIDITYALVPFKTGWCITDTTTTERGDITERVLCFDRSQGMLGGHYTSRTATQLGFRLKFGDAPAPTTIASPPPEPAATEPAAPEPTE